MKKIKTLILIWIFLFINVQAEIPDITSPLTTSKMDKIINYVGDDCEKANLLFASKMKGNEVEAYAATSPEFACYYLSKDPANAREIFEACQIDPNNEHYWARFPACQNYFDLKKLPSVSKLVQVLRKMSPGDPYCSHSNWAGYPEDIEFITADIAPWYWDKSSVSYGGDNDSAKLIKFINLFAWQGLWQQNLVKSISDIQPDLIKELSSHYQKKFDISDKLAQHYAENAEYGIMLDFINMISAYINHDYRLQKEVVFILNSINKSSSYPSDAKNLLETLLIIKANECAIFISEPFEAVNPWINKGMSCHEISSQLSDLSFGYETDVNLSDQMLLTKAIDYAIMQNYPLQTIQRLYEAINVNQSILKLDHFGLFNERLQSFDVYQTATAFYESPLMKAVARPDILAFLLKQGANPNVANAFGKTALMYAGQYNNVQSVNALIQNGADVNAKTSANYSDCGYNLKAGLRTPLMYAAWHADLPVILALLHAGADKSMKDTNGEMAYDYLQKNDRMLPSSLLKAKILLFNLSTMNVEYGYKR